MVLATSGRIFGQGVFDGDTIQVEHIERAFLNGQIASNAREIRSGMIAFAVEEVGLGEKFLAMSMDDYNVLYKYIRPIYMLGYGYKAQIDLQVENRILRKKLDLKLIYRGLSLVGDPRIRFYKIEYRLPDGSVSSVQVMDNKNMRGIGFNEALDGHILPLGTTVSLSEKGEGGLRAVIAEYVYVADINHHFLIQFMDGDKVKAETTVVSAIDTSFYIRKPKPRQGE